MSTKSMPEDKFWLKVDKRGINECWPWMGAGNHGKGSYGRFGINGKRYYAHRLAYYFHYGQSPGDYFVCHSCDNPICCNPHHLWLGTNSDNGFDKISKGRNPKGSKHGQSILNEENVIEIVRLLEIGELSLLKIGEIYGVSVRTISNLKNGYSWGHITGGKVLHGNRSAKLNSDDLREIKILLSQGISRVEISKRFGVSRSTISSIARGESWKNA